MDPKQPQRQQPPKRMISKAENGRVNAQLEFFVDRQVWLEGARAVQVKEHFEFLFKIIQFTSTDIYIDARKLHKLVVASIY